MTKWNLSYVDETLVSKFGTSGVGELESFGDDVISKHRSIQWRYIIVSEVESCIKSNAV